MKLEKDTTISHYKILSEIGKSGMGEVESTRKVSASVLQIEY